MTSARCPKCYNWAVIDHDGIIARHQSNTLDLEGGNYLRCTAAGKLRSKVANQMTGEDILVRNHRYRQRLAREHLQSIGRRRYRR